MTARETRDLLDARWRRGCFVSIGLDPDYSRLPRTVTAAAETVPGASRSAAARATLEFCTAIVAATHEHACAFKPNAAFFEALGTDGVWALEETVGRIHEMAPAVPVIYDAKRGDIGSTNEGYVRHAFDRLGADAITVHPYLGREALAPFLARADKQIIVLCRTSNAGGGEFQDLEIGGRRLFEVVAERVSAQWNHNRNCALVVGATYPDELARVREIVGDMPILIPGVGAQGGDVGRTVAAGQDKHGCGMIINASRSIIFASGRDDFAAAALEETIRLTDEINSFRIGS